MLVREEAHTIIKVLRQMGDAQTWSFVLRIKFSDGWHFCAPKPARTQSPKTLTVMKK
jgi:hypothetical protein